MAMLTCPGCGHVYSWDKATHGPNPACPRCKASYASSSASAKPTAAGQASQAAAGIDLGVDVTSRAHRERTAPQRVIVVDVSMPFASMVAFMVKWSLAAIPAAIILAVVFVVVLAIFAAMGLIPGR